MNPIDKFLNSVTMYRLVNYGLMILAAISVLLSLLKFVSFSPLELIASFLVLTVVCYISNIFFGKFFKVPVNVESSSITALILYFLLWPSLEVRGILLIAFAGLIAMLSKFVVKYKRKHVFNPAAFGAVALVTFSSGALWWVATPAMLPFTLVIGLLIVRKIRRFRMFFIFLVVSFTSFLIQVKFQNLNLLDSTLQFFTSFPTIFFGTIMLTEPLTAPPTFRLQALYAAIVGFLFSWQGPFPIILTTELSLIFGNFFSFLVSPKYRLLVRLEKVNILANDTLEFVFSKPKNFAFKAGQYLEWTLPLGKTDMRGNRRYFTIASSPNEDKIKLGIRFNNPASSFKKFLKEVKVGADIVAGQLVGDFTLPKDPKKKLVFIAGGIGITPFRSMVSDLLLRNEKRDIVIFYANKEEKEVAYKEIFEEAEKKLGIKLIFILTDQEKLPNGYEKGRIDELMIKKYVPDFQGRTFFLSGPIGMVEGYKKLLKGLKVKNSAIVTDYFPGF